MRGESRARGPQATLTPDQKAAKAAVRSKLHAWVLQLEQTQWLWPEVMFQRQLPRLRRVLQHALTAVPFYRQRFEEASLDPAQEYSPEAWARLPILTRRDIQQAGSLLRSTIMLDDPRTLRTIITSGSTGEPIAVLSTALTRFYWSAFTVREHLWHRRDLTRKLAVIRYTRKGRAAPPDGTTRPSWGPATDAAFPTGPGVLLSIDSTIKQQADWLTRQDPGYLLSYPSNLEALANYFIESGQTLDNLRQVRTFGEVVAPELRELVKQAWNIPLVDAYTTQEAGHVALQCPEHDHYHVQSENLLVEVINDQGQPCAPGEIGKVVVTTLHNFATPLIRYEVGDYAEVGNPCPCGRGLPVLKRIMGRQRNMLILPNGEQRWPSFGEAGDLSGLPPLHQFQFIQRSLETIEVKAVVPQTPTPEEEAQARSLLQEMLGHPFEIRFSYVDEIPRSPSGKFEEFRSEVNL